MAYEQNVPIEAVAESGEQTEHQMWLKLPPLSFSISGLHPELK